MADKSSQLILDALSRAVLHPEGLPMHGNKAAPGLFPATSAAKQAAQRSKDEGLFRVLRTEPRGKTTLEICAVTEKGLAQLLSQCSPKHVLEDFVRALDARQTQLRELTASARQTQLGMEALRLVAQQVLEQLQSKALPGTTAGPRPSQHDAAAGAAWQNNALQHLTRWQSAGTSEDCPLPALFRQVMQLQPSLSVGQFHDGLRVLHERGKIYLHPWTGPLYDMPEPRYALLIGHEVLYYASLRQAAGRTSYATTVGATESMPSYEYAPGE